MVASRASAETALASGYPHRLRSSSLSSKHFQQEHLKSLSSGIAEWPHLLQMNLPSIRAIICLNPSSETQWGHRTTVIVMGIFTPHFLFWAEVPLPWILPGDDYRNVKIRVVAVLNRLQAIFFSCCAFSETGVLITSAGLGSKTPTASP